MKLLGAVFVALLAVGPVSAQHWSVAGLGSIVLPGVVPTAPAGAALRGIGAFPALPGVVTLAARSHSYRGTGYGHRRSSASGIYAYPVYVGGFGYGYASSAPDQSTPDANPTAPPAVVINQYFGQPPAEQEPQPDATASNFHYYQAPANDDTAPSDPASYYLIAFKDHTIYSAVAYYTDGDTLHYFTSGNVHNQVSLALVDRQLTEQLNRDRNVDVRLPQ
jgi:hypothetical protein